MKRKVFYILTALIISQMAILGAYNANAAAVRPFIYGIMTGPPYLEPTDAYDSASINVIDQVCESLYEINLSATGYPMVPMLADGFGTWNTAGDELTVNIKQGVTFHDGTELNATHVKWNFDRLLYLLLNEGLQTGDLFKYNNASILNKTEIMSEYQVKFYLNEPLAKLWDNLLTTWCTVILKPNEDYAQRFLTLQDDLIGTGPFTLDKIVPDSKLEFTAYQDYWRAPAKIPRMVWQIIADDDARSLAMLKKEIHMIDSALPTYSSKYEADEDIDFIKVKGLCIYYIAYNMELVNHTLRESMSYAVNVSYLVNEIMEGECYPWKSPVPEGVLYANQSFDGVPNYNVSKARQILVDSGLAALHGLNISSPEADWIEVAESDNPIGSFNFTTHSGLRNLIGQSMQSDYKKIGVFMEMTDLIEWGDFVDKMNGLNGHSKNELTISIGAWCPDYNDPINFLSPLFKNDSTSNQFQINDPQIEQWLLDSYTQAPGPRENTFDMIQDRIITDLIPLYNLWQFEDHTIYDNKVIDNYPVNPFGWLYFYPCDFTEPPAPAIPGYDLYVLTGIMLGVVALLVVKRKKTIA